MTRLLLLLLVVGCGAQMVSKPTTNDPHAPINEADTPGVVKYLLNGTSGMREKRRKDAYKQMYDACNGRYRIIRETEGGENGGTVRVENPDTHVTTSTYTEQTYRYITFACER